MADETLASTSRPRRQLAATWMDLATQYWVRITGSTVNLVDQPWLAGPVGEPRGIGVDVFERLAAVQGLDVRVNAEGAGLISDLELLCGTDFDPRQVHPDVARFYTRTAEYDIDAWAEWSGIFRPFGRALAGLFSRRLQQLNVPLSALDTSLGMTSDIVQLVDRRTSEVRLTAWVRRLHRTGDVLYAGSYSVCFLPGEQRSCVRVAFPLPNGNAMVLMRPISHADGSMTVVSNGRRFGDAGFYFTVHHGRKVWARYLRSLRESIHVFAAPDADVRADHVLTLWGLTFLRLHYRLRRRAAADASPRLASTPP